ncbi:hypothetical protein B0H19DRAFT_958387 [Mycena capillaripes]|nr:hypothetical protein B0H19DRAFT_958387 [Mycena capillaripes]
MSEDGQPSGPTVPPGVAGQADVIKKCNALVQSFRDGTINKSTACAKIMQPIPMSFVEGGPGQQAAESYFEMLEQVAKELADAADRGGGGGSGRRSRSQSEHSRSPSPHGESGSKWRRIDDSKLPWVVDNYILEGTLSPALAKTRAQLIEFSRDPKYVLGTILNSTGHISFPESEWTAIIKRQAVDLNKVITSQYSVSHEWQRAKHIGEGVQLLFGSSTPTKTVSNQAEWITAWTKTAEATIFVFPHRRCELDSYRQYIMDFFSSSGEHMHERIILLDRKLRNEAAGRRDLKLSNCGRFSHWERSFLNDHGAAYLESKPKAKDGGGKGTGSTGGGGDGKKKSPEACKRFNNERCPSSKTSCRYTHICSRCRRNHPVTKCDRPPAIPE